jgi:NADPH:quinone reductase-like Zn-dependent oxidoreductase
MRAVQIHGYGGPDVLQVEEATRPAPAEDELLIRVHAAGVNPLDWKLRSGFYKLPLEFRERAGYTPQPSGPFPFIPGFDMAGVVEATGASVKEFAPGDKVYASPMGGGYAEYVAVAAHDAAHMPQSLDFVPAAAMPVASATAWQALFETMKLEAGHRLLIHGAAGGIGSFAVQLAKWRGAHVIGTASTQKLEYLRQLGADEVIDYTSTRFEEVVSGVDAVLDIVGGDIQRRSLRVLKPDGVLVTIGGPLSPVSDPEHHANIRIADMARPLGQVLAQLARLVDGGHLKPYVSVVFPLQEAHRAHRLIESRHALGKIVLQVRE